jgi:hypothetical protein
VTYELNTRSRYNLSDLSFSAAKAAEWFFIAALSAAMKKNILLSVLCVSSEAGGEIQLTAEAAGGGFH